MAAATIIAIIGALVPIGALVAAIVYIQAWEARAGRIRRRGGKPESRRGVIVHFIGCLLLWAGWLWFARSVYRAVAG